MRLFSFHAKMMTKRKSQFKRKDTQNKRKRRNQKELLREQNNANG